MAVFTARAQLADTYLIPSASMEPTLKVGQRISVDREFYQDHDIEVGDIVVFDGTGSFSKYEHVSSQQAWFQKIGSWFGLVPRADAIVKRVVGAPGDSVECCSDSGRLKINDEEISEPYLMNPDQPAAEQEFSISVPDGRIFVMGDNRYNSSDSTDLLGAPGGGMIRLENIIGPVIDTDG